MTPMIENGRWFVAENGEPVWGEPGCYMAWKMPVEARVQLAQIILEWDQDPEDDASTEPVYVKCPGCGEPLPVEYEGEVEIVPGVMGPEVVRVKAHLHRRREEDDE